MKAYSLLLLLLIAGNCLKAKTLNADDLRRIEQRRVFATGYYRDPRGSSSYCSGASELAFICAAEGKKDSAFYFLNETFSYTGTDETTLNSIYDPYNLGNYPFLKWKNTAEWKAYEHTVSEKYMAMHVGLKQAKLALELLKAFGQDQSVRLYCMKIRNDAQAKIDGRKIDSANLALARQIVKKYGFPGMSMIGTNCYEAVFILCQHADDDLAFQKTILAQLKKLAAAGDAKKEDVAYLTDRIMVKESGTQMYGTQFGNYILYPITDSANVDKRRAEMGLGSLEEYVKTMAGNITPPGRN